MLHLKAVACRLAVAGERQGAYPRRRAQRGDDAVVGSQGFDVLAESLPERGEVQMDVGLDARVGVPADLHGLEERGQGFAEPAVPSHRLGLVGERLGQATGVGAKVPRPAKLVEQGDGPLVEGEGLPVTPDEAVEVGHLPVNPGYAVLDLEVARLPPRTSSDSRTRRAPTSNLSRSDSGALGSWASWSVRSSPKVAFLVSPKW